MKEYIESLSDKEKGALYFQMVQGMFKCLDPDSDVAAERREEAMKEFENGIHLLRDNWGGC